MSELQTVERTPQPDLRTTDRVYPSGKQQVKGLLLLSHFTFKGNNMRPATFSTENPPVPVTCVETLEYIASLRRRIEVQNDQMEHLVAQSQEFLRKAEHLEREVEKLSFDLGVRQGSVPPGTWVEVRK